MSAGEDGAKSISLADGTGADAWETPDPLRDRAAATGVTSGGVGSCAGCDKFGLETEVSIKAGFAASHAEKDQRKEARSGRQSRAKTRSHRPCRHAGDNRRRRTKIIRLTAPATMEPFSESIAMIRSVVSRDPKKPFMTLADWKS